MSHGAEAVVYLKLPSMKLAGQFGRTAFTSRTVISVLPPPRSRLWCFTCVRVQFGGKAASDAPSSTVMPPTTAVSMFTPCA